MNKEKLLLTISNNMNRISSLTEEVFFLDSNSSAGLRAGIFACPRLRFPLRFPGTAAPGNRPGTALP